MKQPNRRQAALCLVASALPLRVQASDSARWLPWPPQRERPALRLPDLDGQPWDLAQELGHPVLLNFWATWCEPCRAEMQSFEVLEQQFRSSGLKVVAVNFREGREPVRRFREAQALKLAFVRDSYGEAAKAWGVHTFPSTFVINPAGRAVLQVEGEVDWANALVHTKLQAFL